MDQVVVNEPWTFDKVILDPPDMLNGSTVCPPGMELLLGTNMFLVHQLIEWIEVITDFDTNNRYEILDMEGRRMFFALEKSHCCLRLCLESERPFTILIMSGNGVVCLKIQRKCTCSYCLCVGCLCNEVHISTANNVLLGKIKQDCCLCCVPRFTVYDADDQAVLKIKGPWCPWICCSVRFKVCNMDGDEIGEIHKQWGGIIKEFFTTATTFGVSFPLEMDPRHKALMLGAVFLIDFMYFEHTP